MRKGDVKRGRRTSGRSTEDAETPIRSTVDWRNTVDPRLPRRNRSDPGNLLPLAFLLGAVALLLFLANLHERTRVSVPLFKLSANLSYRKPENG